MYVNKRISTELVKCWGDRYQV